MARSSVVQKKADKKGGKKKANNGAGKKVLKEGKSSQGGLKAKQGNKGNFHGEALDFLESYQLAYIAAGKNKTKFWGSFWPAWYTRFP